MSKLKEAKTENDKRGSKRTVFISYSRADSGFVKDLGEWLQESGCTVWQDISGLRGGDPWANGIDKAVRGSDVVIVVLSPDSNASEWVRKETLLAMKLHKPIVPVLFRKTEIPVQLVDLQFVDFQADKEAAAQRLLESITNSADSQTVPNKPFRRRQFQRRLVLAIAGIFLGLWLASSLYFWLISKDALRAFENPNSPVNNAPSSETRTAINSKGFTNNVGIEFVWIPPGRFMMGSERDDEKPPHWVTISNGFYMGKYEVTQEEWERVMGIMKSVGGPMYFYGCSRCPVESTTWDEAMAFINKLNARNDGYIYELPSEAKWEYACRASTKGGDGTDFKSVAWYADNSGSELLDATNIWETDNDHYYDRLKSNLEKTHVVGTRKPNAFGLFDMQGNVWEWCADRANDSYEGGPPLDGSAWVKGQEGARIRRGGSFISPVDMLRCATRVRDPAGRRENDIGFRVVAVERQ